jgi:hypothetical protein
MDDRHIQWAKQTFDSLAEHGVWVVPRSGMIFQRQGRRLVLIDKMPWDERLPISEKELAEQQESELTEVTRHMAAAGIEVGVSDELKKARNGISLYRSARP